MHVEDLLTNEDTRQELILIADRCCHFIDESDGFPLLKNLPVSYGDFHKVKVRQRKGDDNLSETFNEAFEDEHYNLRQRAVFANGPVSFEPCDPEQDQLEPFFIFPVNNYRFMYSKEVENSGTDYKQVFDVLYEHFGTDKGNEVATDLLKFAYTQSNLAEGIESGAEIILYNIPFFYAIRTSTIDDYNELLSALEDFK